MKSTCHIADAGKPLNQPKTHKLHGTLSHRTSGWSLSNLGDSNLHVYKAGGILRDRRPLPLSSADCEQVEFQMGM